MEKPNKLLNNKVESKNTPISLKKTVTNKEEVNEGNKYRKSNRGSNISTQDNLFQSNNKKTIKSTGYKKQSVDINQNITNIPTGTFIPNLENKNVQKVPNQENQVPELEDVNKTVLTVKTLKINNTNRSSFINQAQNNVLTKSKNRMTLIEKLHQNLENYIDLKKIDKNNLPNPYTKKDIEVIRKTAHPSQISLDVNKLNSIFSNIDEINLEQTQTEGSMLLKTDENFIASSNKVNEIQNLSTSENKIIQENNQNIENKRGSQVLEKKTKHHFSSVSIDYNSNRNSNLINLKNRKVSFITALRNNSNRTFSSNLNQQSATQIPKKIKTKNSYLDHINPPIAKNNGKSIVIDESIEKDYVSNDKSNSICNESCSFDEIEEVKVSEKVQQLTPMPYINKKIRPIEYVKNQMEKVERTAVQIRRLEYANNNTSIFKLKTHHHGSVKNNHIKNNDSGYNRMDDIVLKNFLANSNIKEESKINYNNTINSSNSKISNLSKSKSDREQTNPLYKVILIQRWWKYMFSVVIRVRYIQAIFKGYSSRKKFHLLIEKLDYVITMIETLEKTFKNHKTYFLESIKNSAKLRIYNKLILTKFWTRKIILLQKYYKLRLLKAKKDLIEKKTIQIADYISKLLKNRIKNYLNCLISNLRQISNQKDNEELLSGNFFFASSIITQLLLKSKLKKLIKFSQSKFILNNLCHILKHEILKTTFLRIKNTVAITVLNKTITQRTKKTIFLSILQLSKHKQIFANLNIIMIRCLKCNFSKFIFNIKLKSLEYGVDKLSNLINLHKQKFMNLLKKRLNLINSINKLSSIYKKRYFSDLRRYFLSNSDSKEKGKSFLNLIKPYIIKRSSRNLQLNYILKKILLKEKINKSIVNKLTFVKLTSYLRIKQYINAISKGVRKALHKNFFIGLKKLFVIKCLKKIIINKDSNHNNTLKSKYYKVWLKVLLYNNFSKNIFLKKIVVITNKFDRKKISKYFRLYHLRVEKINCIISLIPIVIEQLLVKKYFSKIKNIGIIAKLCNIVDNSINSSDNCLSNQKSKFLNNLNTKAVKKRFTEMENTLKEYALKSSLTKLSNDAQIYKSRMLSFYKSISIKLAKTIKKSINFTIVNFLKIRIFIQNLSNTQKSKSGRLFFKYYTRNCLLNKLIFKKYFKQLKSNISNRSLLVNLIIKKHLNLLYDNLKKFYVSTNNKKLDNSNLKKRLIYDCNKINKLKFALNNFFKKYYLRNLKQRIMLLKSSISKSDLKTIKTLILNLENKSILYCKFNSWKTTTNQIKNNLINGKTVLEKYLKKTPYSILGFIAELYIIKKVFNNFHYRKFLKKLRFRSGGKSVMDKIQLKMYQAEIFTRIVNKAHKRIKSCLSNKFNLYREITLKRKYLLRIVFLFRKSFDKFRTNTGVTKSFLINDKINKIFKKSKLLTKSVFKRVRIEENFLKNAFKLFKRNIFLNRCIKFILNLSMFYKNASKSKLTQSFNIIKNAYTSNKYLLITRIQACYLGFKVYNNYKKTISKLKLSKFILELYFNNYFFRFLKDFSSIGFLKNNINNKLNCSSKLKIKNRYDNNNAIKSVFEIKYSLNNMHYSLKLNILKSIILNKCLRLRFKLWAIKNKLESKASNKADLSKLFEKINKKNNLSLLKAKFKQFRLNTLKAQIYKAGIIINKFLKKRLINIRKLKLRCTFNNLINLCVKLNLISILKQISKSKVLIKLINNLDRINKNNALKSKITLWNKQTKSIFSFNKDKKSFFLNKFMAKLANYNKERLFQTLRNFKRNTIGFKLSLSADLIRSYMRSKLKKQKICKGLKILSNKFNLDYCFNTIKHFSNQIYNKKSNTESEITNYSKHKTVTRIKNSCLKSVIKSFNFKDNEKNVVILNTTNFNSFSYNQYYHKNQRISLKLGISAISNVFLTRVKKSKIQFYKKIKSTFINLTKYKNRLSQILITITEKYKDYSIKRAVESASKFKRLIILMKMIHMLSYYKIVNNKSKKIVIIRCWLNLIRIKKQNLFVIQMMKKQSTLDYITMMNEMFSNLNSPMNIDKIESDNNNSNISNSSNSSNTLKSAFLLPKKPPKNDKEKTVQKLDLKGITTKDNKYLSSERANYNSVNSIVSTERETFRNFNQKSTIPEEPVEVINTKSSKDISDNNSNSNKVILKRDSKDSYTKPSKHVNFNEFSSFSK